MKKLLLAGCLLILSGCADVKRQDPLITIEKVESANRDPWVTITYIHHESDDGVPYVRIENAEDLTKYRQQVQFLLQRLDEVQKRVDEMNPPTPNPEERR
jgi:hypothetical protein